jgi:hypothetical protein
MKFPFSKLRALAKHHGATVEVVPDRSDVCHRFYRVMAPAGKLWVASSLPHVEGQWVRGSNWQANQLNEVELHDIGQVMGQGMYDAPVQAAEVQVVLA